jgi:hypothetical protein
MYCSKVLVRDLQMLMKCKRPTEEQRMAQVVRRCLTVVVPLHTERHESEAKHPLLWFVRAYICRLSIAR